MIDEEFKKKYLRCLAYMKLIEQLYENHQESDEESETVHRRLSRRVTKESNFEMKIRQEMFFSSFSGSNDSRTTRIRKDGENHSRNRRTSISR